MNETELEQCRTLLGVAAGVTLEELERVFMKKNFALIKGKSDAADEPNPGLDAQRQGLRAAYEKLSAHLRDQQKQAAAATPRKRPQLTNPPLAAKSPPTRPPMTPLTAPPMPSPKTLITPPVIPPRAPGDGEFALFRFDNWLVNVLVPPLLLGLMGLVNLSPFGFFLKGFHVWMHEFGHSTAAWLTGRRATPLPFGWTPIEPDYSPFVYYGLLLMFVILFLAGLKERKVWPMLAAVVLGVLQYYMTWRLPEHRQEFWWTFGGVGGEFYLSALFMAFFFVQLPEKFRWGACRYVFFLIGATCFLNIVMLWAKVHRGLEEIPFGTMINGEEDQGGDMNKLMDGYGWKKVQIRNTYQYLGYWCWAGLGVMYGIFALRLNRVADWIIDKFSGADQTEAG
jgi:hypothetical protein